MKNNLRFNRRIKTVIIIALCWMFFISFSYVNSYFFVADLLTLNKLSGKYGFWEDFLGNLILGAFGGIAGGYLLVFKMERRYKQRSFLFGIINSGLMFILFYLSVAIFGLFFMGLIYHWLQIGFVTAAERAWRNLLINIQTPSFFVTMCVWGFLVSITQFMLQVNDKFGPGILWKFITGKYYNPREEERIFMFLDLKSSTTIAEKIGNKKFFEFIREVFHDITEPIINSCGEIYQYVGDEVVISWTIEHGLSNNNCLICFFNIEQMIEERKEHYLRKYGLLPSFKAGLHIGEATVGEIGVIKKDIVFSGDVLNTTSRIQGECNNHNVNILLSSTLLQRMPMNGEYEKIPLGEIQLKGKQEMVALNTIKLK